MEKMLRHIDSEVLLGSAKGLEHFKTLKKAAKDRMYDGCGKEWTVLHFLLQLLTLKAKFYWSDNSFNDLLILLGQLLPKPNFVPKNTYEAKKLINPLKMHVQRIHTCPNHCIQYRGDYAALTKCPNCEASRYKSNANFSEDGVDPLSGRGRGHQRKVQFVRQRMVLVSVLKRVNAQFLPW